MERKHSNIELKCPICWTPLQVQEKQQLSNLPTDSYILNALNTQGSASQQKKKTKLMCLDGENEATSSCLNCKYHFFN